MGVNFNHDWSIKGDILITSMKTNHLFLSAGYRKQTTRRNNRYDMFCVLVFLPKSCLSCIVLCTQTIERGYYRFNIDSIPILMLFFDLILQWTRSNPRLWIWPPLILDQLLVFNNFNFKRLSCPVTRPVFPFCSQRLQRSWRRKANWIDRANT